MVSKVWGLHFPKQNIICKYDMDLDLFYVFEEVII